MDFEKDYLDNETSDENIEDLNKDEPFNEKELELEPEKEEPEEQSKGGTKSANDPEPVYFEKFDDALVSDGQGGYTNLGEAVYAKDSGGRTEINELRNLVDNTDGTVHYKGTTTTALSNGSTTNPITIDGESYTAVFGDIVVYGYTEFVFDGTTWSEFGRPFDTTPTSGSANAVTSDGVYQATPMKRGGTGTSAVGVNSNVGSAGYSFAFGSNASASANFSTAIGNGANSSQTYCTAIGRGVVASKANQSAFGKFNSPQNNTIFEIGCGSDNNHRANILEATATSVNINGDIKKNNVSLPTPYTTMPTITAGMVGQVAQYLGATDANYTKGWFYEAVSDGEETPTYSWEAISFNSGGGGATFNGGLIDELYIYEVIE